MVEYFGLLQSLLLYGSQLVIIFMGKEKNMRYPYEVLFSIDGNRRFKAVCETWDEVEASVATYGASNLLAIQENH